MLDRIPVDIVDVFGTIVIIPDAMLPKPTLPSPPPVPPTESRFDHLPPCRIISIAVRQCPERMDMIRQDDDRIDHERSFVPDLAKDVTQMIDLDLVIEDRSPLVSYYCEKI
jgi:hypothetical protein